MTESLLCIGGPFDGQRHENSIDGSQTLVKYVRASVIWPVGEEPVPLNGADRAIYSREYISFGDERVDFWLHESLSPRDAFRRLLDRYKGDAK